jgi:hypothetical protein
MPSPKIPKLEVLVIAAFSQYAEAHSWAKDRLVAEYGPIRVTSPPYAFVQTKYYEESMGPGLQKLFHVFRDPIMPEQLPDVKLLTNRLEAELAADGRFAAPRPVNLDPGLLNLGKFMLATTKDQAHRIYLRDGIFAEVTLYFQAGQFHPWPWTYADYRQPEVLAFLREARNFYYAQLQNASVS